MRLTVSIAGKFITSIFKTLYRLSYVLNGAGKTTFTRTIMGILPLSKGQIWIDGKDMTNQPTHMRARIGVGYMPEDRRLIPEFSVEENILLPLDATGQKRQPERLKWIYELMPEIARFANRKAITLSGGQQKLVASGRALIIGRSLLLLDEPFEGGVLRLWLND